MTKDKALENVASMLAVSCREHQDAAREVPSLRQNTQDASGTNEAIAHALGIAEIFYAKCRLHGVELN